MQKLEILGVHSYALNEHNQTIPQPLINKLYHFLNQFYHLNNLEEFQHFLIRPEEHAELTVLFGLNDEIAGFSRTQRRKVNLEKKQVIVYSALVYLNPNYTINANVANLGLTQAIKYKLSNPHEELIYVAFANDPRTYKFLYELSDTIFPKPAQRIPDQILTVINALKKQSGWISTNNHPWVVNSPLVPIKHQDQEEEEQCRLNEFFLTANPDYMQGNSLLMYMPLHLANIGYGLDHEGANYHGSHASHNHQHQPVPSLDLRVS